MGWPHYRPVVTVADVLESGACYDGVKTWVQRKRIIADDPTKYLDEEAIQTAAFSDGYGYGSGSGYGYGFN